ncbi:hypothetical protein [Spiroplasma citri]|uniref:hypothetical protein n=1 Tax=Spiroplasma citri TaxID=2133 RepID=UPI0011BB7E37|nr:hypothetical protein [Spiroplasma citri]QED24177.1 hypothetical protein FRX96_01360 [Spiroplasma citri]QJU61206.1 hypothetical protein HHA36_01365 [Spiroplasma citri]
MNLNKNNSKEAIQINNQVLYTAMRMASTDSKVIKRKIQELDKWFIFPFVITNGVIPLTTSGYKPINSVPQDYSDFTLAITGNATIIAQWKNAFKLKQVNKGTEEKNFKDADNFYTKIINPMHYPTNRGDMYEAYLQNSTSGAYFSSQGTPDPIFQGISTQRQYTLLSTDKQFGQNDELNLYVVLNKNNENIGGETINTYEYNQSIQWLYISNITDYYDPFDNKKFLFQEITFSSVNDHLSKSGMAIWQKIQHGAIGEGYFFPRIINGVVDYDPVLAEDVGVKWIDLKVLGLTAFSSLTVIGRPIKSGQINKRVYQPRDLLFSDELSGMPDTLLTNSNPANVLYNLQGLKPSNQTTYGEWTNIFNALADPLAKKNAEGVLGSDLIATRATNPNKTPFWDSGLQFKPNGAYDTKQIRKFIYQDPEYKKAPFGVASFDYSQLKSSSFHDVLNANRYTHSSISLLPWDVNEFTKFSLNNLPIVGKIISFFDLGLPVKLMSQKNTQLIPKIAQLNAFIDYLSYEIIQNSLWKDNSAGKGNIPYDMFRNETEDQVGGLIGSNSLTFGCMLKLTDKIKTHYYSATGQDLGTKVYSTIDLGQNRINVNGGTDEIVILSQDFQALDKDTPLTNLDNKLDFNPTADGTLESYVIDLINLQTIGKTNFKITTYSENPFTLNDNITAFQNFQGEWQTMAKFIKPNGNVQAWNSVIKTSALDYDLLEETTFFYPQAVLPPDPFTYKPYTVNILDSNTIKPLKANITAAKQCTSSISFIWQKDWINLFNNKYDNVYYELEVDLKQINTTITTWEQLLNAYSSIQFNNLNNLQVKCAPPNIENFIPNRNINILGGYSTCENNLGWFSNGKLKFKGDEQIDKVNFNGSLIYDLANIKENKKTTLFTGETTGLPSGYYQNRYSFSKNCDFSFLLQITKLSDNDDNKIKELYVQAWHTNDMKLKIRFTKVIFPDFSFFKFKDKRLYQYFGNDKNISIDIDNSNILGIRNKSNNPVSITLIPRS